MHSLKLRDNQLLPICNDIFRAGGKAVRYPMRTNIHLTGDTLGNEISQQARAPISPIVVCPQTYEPAIHRYIVYCTFLFSPLQVARTKCSSTSREK